MAAMHAASPLASLSFRSSGVRGAALQASAPPAAGRAGGRAALRVRAGNESEGGVFAPLVVVTRNIVGVKPFNQFRGKAISLHSQARGAPGRSWRTPCRRGARRAASTPARRESTRRTAGPLGATEPRAAAPRAPGCRAPRLQRARRARDARTRHPCTASRRRSDVPPARLPGPAGASLGPPTKQHCD
jgi:hypothetical protein